MFESAIRDNRSLHNALRMRGLGLDTFPDEDNRIGFQGFERVFSLYEYTARDLQDNALMLS